MAEQDRHEFAEGRLAAAVLAQGAELCSLREAAAGEVLWLAEPAWPRHSPILFPIVGRLAGDTLRHEGRTYRLTQHGFGRDRRFAWAERAPDRCRLVLEDDDATRALYPFAFRLEVEYALAAGALSVEYRVTNTGEVTLPASLGAHPAFRWPLAPGVPREAHRLEFAEAEPEPVRRLAGGLLRREPEPTPIRGATLPLDSSLFEADALILDRPRSRSLRFTAPGAPTLDFSWHGFRELGLWTRAGGDFLCIEPWCGMASEEGFDGEFATKPGLMLIPPGESRALGWRVAVLPAA
ncbi:aldose 1-epimerase family protein [Roseomonas sp. NAR14]|uniref:Aldose 1-epimerase family protein n=1 Tax=Roseomonas acroporae TaxID=2937791 RepID=A0A9X2BWJ3_9PROT|nr:aldose 1-epimerase family protein [Roseomonas acroporae]MCK8783945.1 aldose 1-epimerase family protein [Roseomonas acroporae]